MTATPTTQAPTMIFTTGTPGAGKSTVSRSLFPNAAIIDCDEIKKTHPHYDPKRPQGCHDWSKQVADKMFEDACESGQGVWIYDGTGANAENLVSRIERASQAGFKTVLLYVRCSLETSLRRNAARARTVPEDIVREKARMVGHAFQITHEYAHSVMVFDNDVDGQHPVEDSLWELQIFLNRNSLDHCIF